MEREARIFQKDIHDTDYLSRYREHCAGAESLIDPGGRETESLAGKWSFTIDPYDTALRAGWPEALEAANAHAAEVSARRPPDFDVEAWEEIHVPSCWNFADAAYFWYEGSACYVRRFDAELAPDERVFLCFEGVTGDAYVFLNGRHVAFHRGTSTPFSVEVGPVLRSGTNTLFVVVNNTRADDRIPTSNFDWFNYGGIYRDVFLLRLPRWFVRRFSVGLSAEGYISVSALVDGGAGVSDTPPETVLRNAPESAHVRIPELGVDQSVPLGPMGDVEDGTGGRRGGDGKDGGHGYGGDAAGGDGNGDDRGGGDGDGDDMAGGTPYRREGRAVIEAAPELWSPESPKLYEVELSVGSDCVRDRVGFRRIERRGRRIYLNGDPVFLRGVSYHEDDPELGKSVTEASLGRDFGVAQELGCNFVRLAHYPHSRQAARIADELGLMLWEEIPVYWAVDFRNEETLADARDQLTQLVLRDINRASVIVWSVGNENPDSDDRLAFMSSLVECARRSDGTRLVSAACLYDHEENVIADRLGEQLDLIGINQYFGWYDPAYEKLPDMLRKSDPDRPVVLTEFGGGALAGHRGPKEELFTEDRQREIYRRQIEVIRSCPYVKGITPWILFDFRSPRRTNRYQRFYNRKGLVAEDRRSRKLAFSELRGFYQDPAIEERAQEP